MMCWRVNVQRWNLSLPHLLLLLPLPHLLLTAVETASNSRWRICRIMIMSELLQSSSDLSLIGLNLRSKTWKEAEQMDYMSGLLHQLLNIDHTPTCMGWHTQLLSLRLDRISRFEYMRSSVKYRQWLRLTLRLQLLSLDQISCRWRIRGQV